MNLIRKMVGGDINAQGELTGVFMSPVSPVFQTAVTVSIGLKTVFRVRASILQYLMSMFKKERLFDSTNLYNNYNTNT